MGIQSFNEGMLNLRCLLNRHSRDMWVKSLSGMDLISKASHYPHEVKALGQKSSHLIFLMVPISSSCLILFHLHIGTNSNPILQGSLPTELIYFPSPRWTSLVVNSYYIVFCPHFVSAVCHLAFFPSCLQHTSKKWAVVKLLVPALFPQHRLDMIWAFPSMYSFRAGTRLRQRSAYGCKI